MDAYTEFAKVYDLFMDNIPYEEWGAYLKRLLHENGVDDGLVLELGCGTGTMTEILAEAGYDMIGVDNSEDMLELAMEKRVQSGQDILYLLQDMREFELYGTVRAAVSVCDSVNYITEPEELKEVFRLVNNYLDPEGVFIFDFNTVYKYKEVMGDTVIAEDRGECSFIWDNYYYDEEKRFALLHTKPCDPNLLGVISDMVNCVATVDCCVVYNETPIGYKMSVRSAKKNLPASDLAEKVSCGIGAGGGHANKAGGMLMKHMLATQYPGEDVKEILIQRIREFIREAAC